MRKETTVLIILCFSALISCAPTTRSVKVDNKLAEAEAKIQREVALKTFYNQNSKLQNIAFPLLSGASPLCGKNIKPALGILFANKYLYPEDYQEAAASIWGLDENIKIINIFNASPSDKAGLKIGDILQEVNDQTIKTHKKAVEELIFFLDENLKSNQTVKLKILRNGQEMIINVVPRDVCKYSVILSDSDEVNAYADGKQIFITKGMMRFIESDQELTLVIAHELAHNAMEHMKSMTGNYMLGTIFDNAVAVLTGVNTGGIFGKTASRAYSKEFEQEADYVGLYMMAHAGFEIEGSAYFWRRLAATHPGGIKKSAMSSHPSTPERFIAIEQTIKEIKTKQIEGKPLTPEMQE